MHLQGFVGSRSREQGSEDVETPTLPPAPTPQLGSLCEWWMMLVMEGGVMPGAGLAWEEQCYYEVKDKLSSSRDTQQ